MINKKRPKINELLISDFMNSKKQYYFSWLIFIVDLKNKITIIPSSWVKRLFEDDFHDWKIISLFLIGKHLGKNFKFHNNNDINHDIFLSIYFPKMDK